MRCSTRFGLGPELMIVAPDRPSHDPARSADSTKLRLSWGWALWYGVDEGLAATYDLPRRHAGSGGDCCSAGARGRGAGRGLGP